MRVLVADDDPTSRLIAETAVRNLGHECFTVADGTQAWDAVESGHPDVVLSDWMMPGMTGLELCQRIRSRTSGEYTYLILLTSQGTLDQALEGMSAGADDYLVKPLNLDDLQVRLIAAARVTYLHSQLARQRTELEHLNVELSRIARHDQLTGLGNRRALQEEFEKLEARVARYGHRYSIALVDVDHFKSYNDCYGHLAGDQALRDVAHALNAVARKGDSLYRYGGEEFLCILPERTIPGGATAVERMRARVEGLAISHAANDLGVLTVSAGLSMLDPGATRPVSEVLKEADDALYRAKELGRNRVECTASMPTLDPAMAGDHRHVQVP
jgi:two-component system, cell cycle response regulator